MKDKLGNVKQKLNGQQLVVIKGEIYSWNAVYRVYNNTITSEQLKWKTVMEAMK